MGMFGAMRLARILQLIESNTRENFSALSTFTHDNRCIVVENEIAPAARTVADYVFDRDCLAVRPRSEIDSEKKS